MLSLDLELKTDSKKCVNLNLSTPLELIGRSAQFQRIVEVLAEDGDLLIAGVPGSGRRNMVRGAALEVGAFTLEIDCIRATDGERFVRLLAEAVSQNFDVKLIEEWIDKIAFEVLAFYEERGTRKLQLRSLNPKHVWQAFQLLIEFPQQVAERLNKRVVVILEGFPHIRSWDKNCLWEGTLRREINLQSRVSYVLIATIAEASTHAEETNYPIETMQISPLPSEVLGVWARGLLHAEGLTFDSRSHALQLFLEAVQGHIGDAMAIIRRLRVFRREDGLITEKEVKQAILELLEDLSITFESLLMLLPANQVHILECLAIDPTGKPQSKEYIQKHSLSRGGSLQGALTGLQHKGLIYGAEQGYKVALPLFALWLRQRLS